MPVECNTMGGTHCCCLVAMSHTRTVPSEEPVMQHAPVWSMHMAFTASVCERSSVR